MSDDLTALKIETNGTITGIVLDEADPLASIRAALGESCSMAERVLCYPCPGEPDWNFTVWLDEDAQARGAANNRTAAGVLTQLRPDRVCYFFGTVVLTGQGDRRELVSALPDIVEEWAQSIANEVGVPWVIAWEDVV